MLKLKIPILFSKLVLSILKMSTNVGIDRTIEHASAILVMHLLQPRISSVLMMAPRANPINHACIKKTKFCRFVALSHIFILSCLLLSFHGSNISLLQSSIFNPMFLLGQLLQCFFVYIWVDVSRSILICKHVVCQCQRHDLCWFVYVFGHH